MSVTSVCLCTWLAMGSSSSVTVNGTNPLTGWVDTFSECSGKQRARERALHEENLDSHRSKHRGGPELSTPLNLGVDQSIMVRERSQRRCGVKGDVHQYEHTGNAG